MKSRKGFTLIELMVVLLVIGILAAVAIPLMWGRINEAKWSEGKAGAGTILSAARAFMAEKGSAWTGDWTTVNLDTLGYKPGDLTGRYFTDAAYAITFTGYNDFTITVTAAASASPERPSAPAAVQLNQDGR